MNPLNWRSPAALTLWLAALLFLASPAALAQTQTPEPAQPASASSEVDQLKTRLKQLEQTVQELKGQIEAIETRKTTAPAAPAIVQATYSDSATPPAETAAATAPAKAQDAKGESTFEIYGFAMLDAGYQFKQNDPNWFDVVRPTKLPA